MPPPAATPLTVLVVDDVPDAADSMAACIALHGHAVTAVYSGEEAVRRAAVNPPDVVLLDVTMPGMDGFELARRLPAAAGGRRPFLVAVTGRTSHADRQTGREAGCDLYVAKPIDPALVADMLDRISRMLAPPPA